MSRDRARSLLLLSLILIIVEGDIVLANHLGNMPAGLELEFPEAGPWLRISLGIINGDIHAQLIVLRTRDALYDVQLVGVWKAGAVDPGLVVEADRVDHQRISFPPADRVSHPSRIDILGMLAALVGIDLAN